MNIEKIHYKLIPWYKKHGRHDLPWQIAKSPYTVWVSEIMLQQTQVQTVIPYYLQFIQRFPSIEYLAAATIDDVLTFWSGLGYYSRARNLYKTALIIANDYRGEFPDSLEALTLLPGIGPSTAAAILSLAFNKAAAILDGNVKRVLCRYHALAIYPDASTSLKSLAQIAMQHLPESNFADYTQAIMDLGATVCTKSNPNCAICPLFLNCNARQQGIVDTLPLVKQNKKAPTKIFYYAIVLNKRKKICLIKRPLSGIWGGLWTFPEAESQTALENQLENALGLKCIFQRNLENIKHAFSHFKLDIRPILYTTEQSITRKDVFWYFPHKDSTIAVAKPVASLLSKLSEII